MALPLSTPPEIGARGAGRGVAWLTPGTLAGMLAFDEPGFCGPDVDGALPKSVGSGGFKFSSGLGDELVSLLVPDDRSFALLFVFERLPIRLQSERASMTTASASRDFMFVLEPPCQNRERTGVPTRAARVGWW